MILIARRYLDDPEDEDSLTRGMDLYTSLRWDHELNQEFGAVFCVLCNLDHGRLYDRFGSYSDVMRHVMAHKRAGDEVTKRDINRIKQYRKYIESILEGAKSDRESAQNRQAA